MNPIELNVSVCNDKIEEKVNKIKKTKVEKLIVDDEKIILVKELSENFSQIIKTEDIEKHKIIWWGGNGVGSRFANGKFNYSSIYSYKKPKRYSENITDDIPTEIIEPFIEESRKNTEKKKGIIGIFIHSLRKNNVRHPIRDDILKIIHLKSCIECDRKEDIICDHKNDLYNNERVLNTKTQLLSDFQPLCNGCNLLKRQINIEELENNKLYSIKQKTKNSHITFVIPWEKKTFDINNIHCKEETYWYDPEEFNRKLNIYTTVTITNNNLIKKKVKKIE